MNSTILTPLQQSQLTLLRAHFGSPGNLSGTDLIYGRQCDVIYPMNLDEYFTAHLLGPGRMRTGAEVIAADAEGALHQFHSFFRSQVLPLDDDRSTSTISLTIAGQAGLEPTQAVRNIVDELRAHGWPIVLERSFRIMRWTLWTLLDTPVGEEVARDIAYRQYCVVRDKMLIDQAHIQSPLLDQAAEPTHLPFQFFSGNFFGMLYQLHGSRLLPLDFHKIPHYQPSSGDTTVHSFGDDEAAHALEKMIATWWTRFENRRIRAGELLTAVEGEDVSINSIVPPGEHHRRAIELGQKLKRLDGSIVESWTIHARSSGHGTTFFLTPAESSTDDACSPDS